MGNIKGQIRRQGEDVETELNLERAGCVTQVRGSHPELFDTHGADGTVCTMSTCLCAVLSCSAKAIIPTVSVCVSVCVLMLR